MTTKKLLAEYKEATAKLNRLAAKDKPTPHDLIINGAILKDQASLRKQLIERGMSRKLLETL